MMKSVYGFYSALHEQDAPQKPRAASKRTILFLVSEYVLRSGWWFLFCKLSCGAYYLKCTFSLCSTASGFYNRVPIAASFHSVRYRFPVNIILGNRPVITSTELGSLLSFLSREGNLDGEKPRQFT